MKERGIAWHPIVSLTANLADNFHFHRICDAGTSSDKLTIEIAIDLLYIPIFLRRITVFLLELSPLRFEVWDEQYADRVRDEAEHFATNGAQALHKNRRNATRQENVDVVIDWQSWKARQSRIGPHFEAPMAYKDPISDRSCRARDTKNQIYNPEFLRIFEGPEHCDGKPKKFGGGQSAIFKSCNLLHSKIQCHWQTIHSK